VLPWNVTVSKAGPLVFSRPCPRKKSPALGLPFSPSPSFFLALVLGLCFFHRRWPRKMSVVGLPSSPSPSSFSLVRSSYFSYIYIYICIVTSSFSYNRPCCYLPLPDSHPSGDHVQRTHAPCCIAHRAASISRCTHQARTHKREPHHSPARWRSPSTRNGCDRRF
jgi:hypothetical protein